MPGRTKDTISFIEDLHYYSMIYTLNSNNFLPPTKKCYENYESFVKNISNICGENFSTDDSQYNKKYNELFTNPSVINVSPPNSKSLKGYPLFTLDQLFLIENNEELNKFAYYLISINPIFSFYSNVNMIRINCHTPAISDYFARYLYSRRISAHVSHSYNSKYIALFFNKNISFIKYKSFFKKWDRRLNTITDINNKQKKSNNNDPLSLPSYMLNFKNAIQNSNKDYYQQIIDNYQFIHKNELEIYLAITKSPSSAKSSGSSPSKSYIINYLRKNTCSHVWF